MSERFTNYIEARKYAGDLANHVRLPVAIRFVKEFSKWGYNVSLLDRHDVKSEQVHPDERGTV